MHSEHFKQSANTSQKMSIKIFHCTATIHLLKRCMACSNILEIAPDSHVRLAGGIISEPYILEHVQRKKARCAKTQTSFVQMSLSDVDSVRARKILSMQMAVLPLSCYTQSFNNMISIVNDFFYLIIPLSVAPIRFLPVNKKKLKIFRRIQLITKHFI